MPESAKLPTVAAANVALLAFFLYLPTSTFTHMPYIISKKSMPLGLQFLLGLFYSFGERERAVESCECSLLKH